MVEGQSQWWMAQGSDLLGGGYDDVVMLMVRFSSDTMKKKWIWD